MINIFFYQGVTMETAAILDCVCPSWEHDIFVVNAPNAVKIAMQLAEGEAKLFCPFLECDLKKYIFIFQARKTFVNAYIHMLLYKHCVIFFKEQPCLSLQHTLKMYSVKFQVIPLKNS